MRLKLIKGKSYTGIVHATAENPVIEVDEEVGMIALNTGYFESLDLAALTQEEVPDTAEDIE